MSTKRVKLKHKTGASITVDAHQVDHMGARGWKILNEPAKGPEQTGNKTDDITLESEGEKKA